MPVFAVVMEILQGTWEASLLVLPVLVVLLAAWSMHREEADVAAAVSDTFDGLVPALGEAVVYGVVLAGVLHTVLGMAWLQWAVPVLILLGFSYYRWDRLQEIKVGEISAVRGGVYGGIVLAAAAATVFRTELLLHVAATGFYATLFWKL